MGNKDSKTDLEFSAEELLDLERSRQNRSRFTPDGRPRERTHKKGLRIPADVVPHRMGERSDPDLGPAAGGREASRSAPRPLPGLPPARDVTGRKPSGRPPASRTLPLMAPPPAPILEGDDSPVDRPPPALLWPRGPVDPEDAPTEPQLVPRGKPSELDTDPIRIEGVGQDAVERDPPVSPAPPPAVVHDVDPEDAVTEIAAPLLPPGPPEALDGGAPSPTRGAGEAFGLSGVVQKAVQLALESAGSAPPVALAERDFDLDQPTGPGASRDLEELSGQQAGSGIDQDRAGRVAILLSALRPSAGGEPVDSGPPGTAAEGLEPVGSGEIALPEEFSPDDPAPNDVAPWANEMDSPEPDGDSPWAPSASPGVARAAVPASEMEELSGEEFEEVAAATDAAALPPPIPDAPSPFEAEAEVVPAPIVEVTVPVTEPVEDDAIMTSAPPEHPPSPPLAAAVEPPPPPELAPSREPASPPEPSPLALAVTSPEVDLARGAEALERGHAAAAIPAGLVAPAPAAAAGVPPAVLASQGAAVASSVASSPFGTPAVAPAQGTGPSQAALRTTPLAAQTRGRKRKRSWFEEIFDEDWLRTLRPRGAEQMRKEVEFLEDSLQPSKDSQVLDLGCGDGRHALELAARGYQVTGYDLSLPLLIRAADEAQRRDLHVNFVHGDFRELSFGNQFDAAYCLFTSFGYFDDDANRRMIQAANNALKVGGRFLLDVVNRDYVIGDVPARIWWEGVGCVVLEEVDFNYFTSRIISKRSVVFEDGRHLEQEISVRSYSLHELGKIMHHAGFRVLEVSGNVAHRTRFFGSASRSLVLLAEKRGSGA